MGDSKRLGLAAVLIAALGGLAAPVSAQATRTWVSGVGDDVNPCSRTAPCKTFAGAISKTAAGGEINCLDPGGFGGVTITKAVTIICDYTEGGALSSGNGIVISLSNAEDTVLLSGLDIFGSNMEGAGVRFVGLGAVHVRNSTIRGFRAGAGITAEPKGPAMIIVTDSTLSGNKMAIVAAGAAQVIVGDSTIVSNGTGLSASGGARILSAGGNLIAGNGSDGRFGGTLARQ